MRISTSVEEACQVGKHYAPFRCEYVPNEVILQFCERYPKLCKLVFWDLFLQWLKAMDYYLERDGHVLNFKREHNNFRKHPLAKKLTEIANREFHYEKSTVSADHIVTRFGKVYRYAHGWDYWKRRNQEWRSTNPL